MKKVSFLIVVFSLALCASAWAEEMTLVTYYPAPFGMYQEMRVMGQLGVGISDVEDDSRMQVMAEDGGAYKTVAKFVQGDTSDGSYGIVVQQGAALPVKTDRGAIFVTSDGNAAIFEGSAPNVTKNVFLSRTSIGRNENPNNSQLYVNTARGNVLIKEDVGGEGFIDPHPILSVFDATAIAPGGQAPIAVFASGRVERGIAVAAVSEPAVGVALPAGNLGLFATGRNGAGLFRGNVNIEAGTNTPGNLSMDGGDVILNGGWLTSDGDAEGILIDNDGNVDIPGYTLASPGPFRPNNFEVTGAFSTAHFGGRVGIGTNTLAEASPAALEVRGQVGINRQVPVAALDVNGAVRVGFENPGVCNETRAGMIRFQDNHDGSGGIIPGYNAFSSLAICAYNNNGAYLGNPWQWFRIYGSFIPSPLLPIGGGGPLPDVE